MIKREKKDKISIIIPLLYMDNYVHETLSHLLKQKYEDFEIILLPNEPLCQEPQTRVWGGSGVLEHCRESKLLPAKAGRVHETRGFSKSKNPFGKRVRIFPTGNIQPAEKRNIGARKARGSILSFIDDDAYPTDENWLSRAAECFKSSERIGAVGGPNMTPPKDGKFQTVCGEVLASPLFSGPASIRYKRGKAGPYNDLPSCNLFVDKEIFNEVNGFYPYFWPGEDTKLCADILRLKRIILYDPDIAVYHHRRKGWEGYVRQTFRFGLHRGYFMKIFSYTSLHPIFFIPSVFVIWLLFGSWLGLVHQFFLYFYLTTLIIYSVLVIAASTSSKHFSTIPLFALIGFATHVAYGIGVIVGIIKPVKQSKLKP